MSVIRGYFPASLCSTSSSTALALIVGVSDYSGFSDADDLPGACNDVELWWTFLTTKLNIPRENICVLASPIPGSPAEQWLDTLKTSGQAPRVFRATRSNIIQATFQLAELLSGGNHAGVLTWSGHGAVTTHSNQAQGAGKVLCPEDVSTSADGTLTNVVGVYENLQADVHAYLNSLQTPGQDTDDSYDQAMDNLTLILDTCYVEPGKDADQPRFSRALSRGSSLPVPTPPSFLPASPSSSFLKVTTPDAYQDGRLLLASQFSEPAYEIKTGTRYHGAFSWALRTAMEQWTTQPLLSGQPDGPRRLNVTYGNLLFPTRNLLQALSVSQTPVFGGIGLIQDLAVFQLGVKRPVLGSTRILPDFHRPSSQLTGAVEGFTVFSLNLLVPHNWSQSVAIVTGSNVSGLKLNIGAGGAPVSAESEKEYWFQTPSRADDLIGATKIELRARTACKLQSRTLATATAFNNQTSAPGNNQYLKMAYNASADTFTLSRSPIQINNTNNPADTLAHRGPTVTSRINTAASVPANSTTGLLQAYFKADELHSGRQIWLSIEAKPLGGNYVIDRIIWYISGTPIVSGTVFGSPPANTALNPVYVFPTGNAAFARIKLTRMSPPSSGLSSYQKWAWPLS